MEKINSVHTKVKSYITRLNSEGLREAENLQLTYPLNIFSPAMIMKKLYLSSRQN
jgi:hypothetical protein